MEAVGERNDEGNGSQWHFNRVPLQRFQPKATTARIQIGGGGGSRRRKGDASVSAEAARTEGHVYQELESDDGATNNDDIQFCTCLVATVNTLNNLELMPRFPCLFACMLIVQAASKRKQRIKV